MGVYTGEHYIRILKGFDINVLSKVTSDSIYLCAKSYGISISHSNIDFPGYIDVSSCSSKNTANITALNKIIVDDWQQVKHRMYSTVALMWRDGLFTDEEIYAEMGEIVTGQKQGRETQEEILLFSPIGMGLHDLALAHRIYQSAQQLGLGQKVTLWEAPLWM